MIKEFFLNNRIFAAKKTISIILILFGIFFVLSNRDVYYSLHSSFVPLEEELQENEAIIRFSGNMTFEQEFRCAGFVFPTRDATSRAAV